MNTSPCLYNFISMFPSLWSSTKKLFQLVQTIMTHAASNGTHMDVKYSIILYYYLLD
jgi:hypothetical protein